MRGQRRFYVEIFLISFAALLLEISYTRVVSFKLFYYYTYLIIGFALLGIGSGGVFVAILPRLRQLPLERLLAVSCLAGAVVTGVGYLVIAHTPLATDRIWGPGVGELAKLVLICAALFATFLSVGVAIASLFARNPQSIHPLYFADLLGAGLACAAVVPLMWLLTPPGCVSLGGALLAVCGARLALGRSRALLAACAAAGVILAAGAFRPGWLPDLVTEDHKSIKPDTPKLFSEWSPVFRVDLTRFGGEQDDVRLIHHDGQLGSTLHRWNGDVASLTRFDRDARSYPFRLDGRAPREVLIIGAAGGHEILAALYFGAERVTAVELNPVTQSLLTEHFVDYTGNLARHPKVTLVNDEGRSFLARKGGKYDVIFFVAPDSYSAMNAATAGAFVLSESYLYTKEMIVESLEHLTEDGVIAMHFGEFAYDRKPNRTARYVGTARRALESLGVEDASRHVLVATTPSFLQLSTILVKRRPFTEPEIAAFLENAARLPGDVVRVAPGRVLDDGPVAKVISLPEPALVAWYAGHAYDVAPVVDDKPFFWHFARFRTVLQQFGEPLRGDTEDAIGERLLLVLLGISAAFAGAFLLLPFVAIRDAWSALPRKAHSFALFAAIGLGFMFFEITLIQKLTLFLGYPTYSLTVTLMSILIFTGLGSLLAGRFGASRNRTAGALFAVIATLTAFYLFGMGALTDAVLGSPLGVRVALAVAMIAPLGLALGAFMPLGLSTLASLTPPSLSAVYVAWGWAVNGFFSVLGSVLTTILSMTWGFRTVLLLGLCAYAAASLLLWRLPLGPKDPAARDA
jgi:spermidine synthase